MAPIDEWLNAWLMGEVGHKHGAYQSPGPLHVYAMYAGGGVEFSGPLPAWPDLAERLRGQHIQLGLIAVEVPADHAYFKYPGVTLAFDGPRGGIQIAREVMLKLGKLGVGGVLAGTENNGRFGVLRIIMVPRWYAKTGDNLFGLDWSKVPNDPVHCEEAKKAWALGMHAALRMALADIPEMFIDTIKLGTFDVVDWLHDLGPREAPYLFDAQPYQIDDALYQMGSFDLDELSSVTPRAFAPGEVLQTIYDELEQAITFDQLKAKCAETDTLFLHARGRAESYNSDLMLLLLRRRADRRVRLTVVRFSPNEEGTWQDYYEVNPEFCAWPSDEEAPSKGAALVLQAFIERYGDTFESGTLHAHSSLISAECYQQAVTAWLLKSPSASKDYQMLADLRIRVHALMRWTVDDEAEERALIAEEAEELFTWITEAGQGKVETEWLLMQWEREWRPSGMTSDEAEKLLGMFDFN